MEASGRDARMSTAERDRLPTRNGGLDARSADVGKADRMDPSRAVASVAAQDLRHDKIAEVTARNQSQGLQSFL